LEFDEEFAENQEKDWKTVRWWHNKCAVIQARDSYPKCKPDYIPGTVTHCNLEALLKSHMLTHPEAIQKMKVSILNIIGFTLCAIC
jgi:cancer susceptibility candidate protein 1